MTVIRTADGSETWDKYGVCTSAEVKYLVQPPTTKQAAIQAVIAAAPDSYGSYDETYTGRNPTGASNHNILFFQEVRFDGYTGGGDLEATAVYTQNEVIVSGSTASEPVMTFECGGGTKHVVHAISQAKWRDVTITGGTTGEWWYTFDDAGGNIGWNGKSGADAEFAGVDVPTADLRESYTINMKRSAITNAFKRTVADLTGKVNAYGFRGYKIGEVLFVGASYSAPLKGKDDIQVKFDFRISLKETNAIISGTTVGEKEGWEYVWARSEVQNETDQNSPDFGAPKVVVNGIYKSRVVEYGDFALLGSWAAHENNE